MVIYTVCLIAGFFYIFIGITAPVNGGYFHGKYPPLIMAVALLATYTGGGALFGISALAQKFGYWALIDCIASGLALVVTAVLVQRGAFGKTFARDFFDPNSRVTDQSFLSLHFLSISALYILVIAAQLKAANQLAVQIGLPGWVGVASCVIFVGGYASKGFAATTRTDIAQVLCMIPLYVILAMAAFGEISAIQSSATTPAVQLEMPLPLCITLALPFIFIPLSQELMQRNASAGTNEEVAKCNLVAAILVIAFGGTLTCAFAYNPAINFSALLNGPGYLVPSLVALGVMAAILSTMDTAANISSRALGDVPMIRMFPPTVRAWLSLIIAGFLFSFFPTVLTMIYAAIFVYLSGPAMCYLAVWSGVRPRVVAPVGSAFVAAQIAVGTDNELLRNSIRFVFGQSADSTVVGLSLAAVELILIAIARGRIASLR
jgi:hypothetical protein